MERRDFIQGAAAGMLLAAARGCKAKCANDKTIGMQVGAVSFIDEGTERVLDELETDAKVNTLFIATFHLWKRHRRPADSGAAISRSR